MTLRHTVLILGGTILAKILVPKSCLRTCTLYFRTLVHMYMCLEFWDCICVHIYTYTSIRIYICMHVYIEKRICSCIHTLMSHSLRCTYTHIHTHSLFLSLALSLSLTHTHTHTHTHIYTSLTVYASSMQSPRQWAKLHIFYVLAIFTRTITHTYTQTHIHTHTPRSLHLEHAESGLVSHVSAINVHTHNSTHTRIHARTYIAICA